MMGGELRGISPAEGGVDATKCGAGSERRLADKMLEKHFERVSEQLCCEAVFPPLFFRSFTLVLKFTILYLFDFAKTVLERLVTNQFYFSRS